MSWRPRLVLALALAVAGQPVVAAPAAHADAPVAARPGKRTRAATRKRTRARTVTRTVRGKRAGRAAPMATNMPDGWSWPPTASMRRAGKACTARLDELGVTWKPAAAQRKIATPITVPSMTFGEVKLTPTFRKPPFVMDCHLALALTTFADGLRDLGVREVKFSRIHGYTKVRTGGRIKNALSRHALGLAVDIRAVVGDDGHEAWVVKDYLAGDPLLLQLEQFLDSSGGFRTVLTPRNDPASHDDHFHVEVALEYGP